MINVTETRKLINSILSKYDIDNLQLEIDMAELFRRLTATTTSRETAQRIADAIGTGAKNAETREQIESAIKVRLHINPTGDRWERFIEHAYLRAKEGEMIETFVSWWLLHGGEPQYWSPARMIELWPQAFFKRKRAPQADVEQRKYTLPPEGK